MKGEEQFFMKEEHFFYERGGAVFMKEEEQFVYERGGAVFLYLSTVVILYDSSQ